jgi:nitroreductase
MTVIEYNQPISNLIQKRFSCRTYQTRMISDTHLNELEGIVESCRQGPLKTNSRFRLVAAREGDSQALRGLGTYGFIKHPAGFILGACQDRPYSLEDFGYLLETILLYATQLGIGTCWLGGTFTKSRFARAMNLTERELLPCVASIGYPAQESAWIDHISRLYAGADRRLCWKELFFINGFEKALFITQSGNYFEPLEMVRLAPSASNRQPWRVVKDRDQWHFYLQRTPNYPSSFFHLLVNLADLQRVDLGIAMAHFELSARDLGLNGTWMIKNPKFTVPDKLTEYIVTWQAKT